MAAPTVKPLKLARSPVLRPSSLSAPKIKKRSIAVDFHRPFFMRGGELLTPSPTTNGSHIALIRGRWSLKTSTQVFPNFQR